MATTFTTKLGTTKRAGPRSRIWIEGDRLIVPGFTHKALFSKEWRPDDHELILRVVDRKLWHHKLSQAERGLVSGRADRPVIDITGARVTETFRTDRVIATFSRGRIVITEVSDAAANNV